MEMYLSSRTHGVLGELALIEGLLHGLLAVLHEVREGVEGLLLEGRPLLGSLGDLDLLVTYKGLRKASKNE